MKTKYNLEKILDYLTSITMFLASLTIFIVTILFAMLLVTKIL